MPRQAGSIIRLPVFERLQRLELLLYPEHDRSHKCNTNRAMFWTRGVIIVWMITSAGGTAQGTPKPPRVDPEGFAAPANGRTFNSL